MLKQRVLTALLLVPVMLIGVLYIKTSGLAAFLGVIVSIGAWEWTKFAEIKRVIFRICYVAVVVVALSVSFYFKEEPWSIFVTYIGALWWLIAFASIVAVEKKLYTFTKSTLITLFIGLLVLVPAWQSIILIHGRTAGDGPMQLIFLLLLIWTADISAYFTGRKWGNKKLSPTISPGKTWQGAIGGIIACFFLALIFGIKTQLHVYDIIIFLTLTSLTVMVSIIGDLFESLMKRRVNLKDSGNLLPGHGGVLDRIDSLSAAAPFFLTTMLLTGAWS
ncbi:MAG: phosphatidate cytidylyltransferase [Gammaproteobacteria bacterium]|jgi:phosphatidate cytidylyltransferase